MNRLVARGRGRDRRGHGGAAILVVPPTRGSRARRPYMLVTRAHSDAAPTRRVAPSAPRARCPRPAVRAAAASVAPAPRAAHRPGRRRLALLLAKPGLAARAGRVPRAPVGEACGRRRRGGSASRCSALGARRGSPRRGFRVGLDAPRSVDRAVTERAERIRLELYTVNQLLAMHVRTGAGPMQAVQRVVDRGRGVVVEELRRAARRVRNGVREVDAFRRAGRAHAGAERGADVPAVRRGVERGVDLAGGCSRSAKTCAKRVATSAKGGGAPPRRDAPPDDRDPRSDHAALHRRAPAVDRARSPLGNSWKSKRTNHDVICSAFDDPRDAKPVSRPPSSSATRRSVCRAGRIWALLHSSASTSSIGSAAAHRVRRGRREERGSRRSSTSRPSGSRSSCSCDREPARRPLRPRRGTRRARRGRAGGGAGRSWSRAECEDRAREVVDGLLHGALGPRRSRLV